MWTCLWQFRGTVLPHGNVYVSIFLQCYFYLLLVSNVFWQHRQKGTPKRMLLWEDLRCVHKNKDRKSRTKCSMCKKFICAEHQNKVNSVQFTFNLFVNLLYTEFLTLCCDYKSYTNMLNNIRIHNTRYTVVYTHIQKMLV